MPFEPQNPGPDETLDSVSLRNMGYTRARDAIFDAVFKLWQRRKEEGLTQKEIGHILERDPAWVSRALAGPSNWTVKTFGEMVEGLRGHIEIQIIPIEDLVPHNYDVYEDLFQRYDDQLRKVDTKISSVSTNSSSAMRISSVAFSNSLKTNPISSAN